METLLPLLTLVVTVLGWFYTARKQSELSNQIRAHQVRDRELAAFRARLPIVRELVEALSERSSSLSDLSILAKQGAAQFDIGEGTEVLRRANDGARKVLRIQSDADYLRLRRMLSKDDNERIRAAVDKAFELSAMFGEKYRDLDPEADDYGSRLAAMAIDAEALGFEQLTMAQAISGAFASLDERMANTANEENRG